MPAAANLYHLTTARKQNKHGKWFVLEVGAPVFIRSEEAEPVVGDATRAYTMARSLASAVSSGQKIIRVDDDDDTGEGGHSGGNNPDDGVGYVEGEATGEPVPF